MNMLKCIFPSTCETAGLNYKTTHSLRVTRATSLFNAGIEEKMIRERTGHRSSALFGYEKPGVEKVSEVSNILGPCTSLRSEAGDVKLSWSVNEKKDSGRKTEDRSRTVLESGIFFDCNIIVVVNKD